MIKDVSKKGKVLEKKAVRAGLSGHKAREARLRWFGHVQKIGTVSTGRRMLRLEVGGRKSGGREKRRFMGVVKEDMKLVGMREEDRLRWRRKIGCGNKKEKTIN